jgi:hypothetical protein
MGTANMEFLSSHLAQAAITKYHKLGSLNNTYSLLSRGLEIQDQGRFGC